MFGDNEKEKSKKRGKVETIIGTGTKIEGDIQTKGSLRVEGEIVGNIKAEGDLFVGEEGKLETEIEARNVVIAGKVKGNIKAHQKLEILPQGHLNGDIKSDKLKIEEGAVFIGNSKTLKDADNNFKTSDDNVTKMEKVKTEGGSSNKKG